MPQSLATGLVHLGEKPLAVDLSGLSVRAVLWGRGYRKLGDWNSSSMIARRIAAEAGKSWNVAVPLDHDFKTGKDKVLHLYATFAVTEDGQRADVTAQHIPPIPE